MLKYLRKKGVAKKILWFIAVIIILSFGVFGSANYLRNTRQDITYAGMIFGRKVSFKEFRENLQQAKDQAMLQYRGNFAKISSLINLNAEAWDRLILLHEAKERHIKVSNEDVVRTIAEFPMFQRNGRFDPLIYNETLRYWFKTRPRDFEEGIRTTLMFNKIYEQEIGKVTISEEELWEAYRKQNEKIQVSYVLVTPQDLTKDVSSTDEEVRTYFEANKFAFLLPADVNVEFLKVDLPENADPAVKAAASTKTETIAQALSTNPDFTAVAKQFGLEAKESGFFSQDAPNLNLGWSFELLQEIFKLPPKAISAPIATDEGYYIVRIKEKRESRLPEFDDVKDQVIEQVQLTKAKQMAKAKTQEVAQKIQEQKNVNPSADFAQIAKNLNLNLQQTPLFNRGQYVPNIGIAKEFQEAAFALKDQNAMSEVVETPKGFCILHLDSFVPVNDEQFEKDREAFRQQLLADRTNEAFNELLTRLRIKADLKDNISRMEEAGRSIRID